MTDATWLGAFPAFLVAIAVLLVPGLVATAPIRAGLTARIALSGSTSAASIGVAGVVAGLAHARFAWWQPLAVAVVLGIVVWFVCRRWAGVRLPSDRVPWYAILLSLAVTGAVIGVVAYASVPSPERVSQTYDNVFHMSAIAAILQDGDASSLTLRTLIETGRSFAFYPAAWHSIAALVATISGAPVAVAVNASWLAVAAVVWVPGCAWLAQVLVPRARPGLIALIALPLAAAFGGMPYALLSWGTLYPNFLATALLPVAVAIPVLALRGLRTARSGARTSVATVGAFALVMALTAVALAQPRVLATWFVIVLPFVVAVLARGYRRAWRAGGRARRRASWALAVGAAAIVLVAAVGFVYLVVRLGLFDRPLDERLGGPQAKATQSVIAGLWQVLSQSWLTGTGTATWPSILLAVAVAIGVVAAARRRGSRWVVFSYGVLALLFAIAAGSDDTVTKLATALWYKDRYRLSSALPMLGVVFATWGILVAARWMRRRQQTSDLPIALTWIVTVSAAATLALTGTSAAIGLAFRMPDTHADSAVVSRAQIAFFGQLDRFVPQGQRVLGDPWDGSAWTQLYGEREPVFPHVNGQWDSQRLLIATALQNIGTDPAVCAALDTLRVRYITYDPHIFGGGDPSGNHFAAVHAAVEAGLFTEVATGGTTALYRIDQCGDLPPLP